MSENDDEQLEARLENIKLVQEGHWSSLNTDIQDLILSCLPLGDLFKVRLVSKSFSKVLERGTFHQARVRLQRTECSLSPLVFYAEKDSWHLRGFDSKEKVWKKLPPFKHPIPAPDPDLFKDLHIAGDKGLFCVNEGKANEAEQLFVCNPLMGATFKLPPLKFSRHPVLIHVHVTLTKRNDSITSNFWVIAVGSAAIGTESQSRKTEIYDSALNEWLSAGDVPGKEFSLNDYQTGVYCESQDLLLCVGFMGNGIRGILAFDVGKRKWRDNWICPFFQPHPITETALTVYFAIAQLVICSGVVYLFSEQEAGRNVTHCIDRLDLEDGGEFGWTRVVTRPRQGNRALLVYPEYTCVPLGENKLCIFNTIERTGVVYDMSNATNESSLSPPPVENGVMFHSLNPVSYAFEPSFGASVPKPKPKDGQGSSTNGLKEEPPDSGSLTEGLKEEPPDSHGKSLTK